MAGFDRFGRLWANKGAVSMPTDQQHDSGFSFLGTTPPGVELFNGMFQERDQQIAWLFAQLRRVLLDGGITPASTPDNQLAQALQNLLGGGGNLTLNWQRLPGGVIIQWGTSLLPTNPTGTAVAMSVSFNVAFPAAVSTIIANAAGTGNTASGGVPAMGITNATRSGFTATADVLGWANINKQIPFYWFALGR